MHFNFMGWVFVLNDQRWEYMGVLCILPCPTSLSGRVDHSNMAPCIIPPCGHTSSHCDVALSPIKCQGLFLCLLEYEVVWDSLWLIAHDRSDIELVSLEAF